MAPRDQETLDTLLSKHPQHPEPINFPDPPDVVPLDLVSSEEVRSIIKSFPPGSAGGLDALRPQILKDLMDSSLGV